MCIPRQTTGSLYFWAAHLAGPKWGPFASWCCAWLETVGSISGIGTQVFFSVFFWSLFTSLSVSFSLLLLGNGEWGIGIFRSTGTANDHSAGHWNTQKWRIFCSKGRVCGSVHEPSYYMGNTQQLLITSHCISGYNFLLVAGIYCERIHTPLQIEILFTCFSASTGHNL